MNLFEILELDLEMIPLTLSSWLHVDKAFGLNGLNK